MRTRIQIFRGHFRLIADGDLMARVRKHFRVQTKKFRHKQGKLRIQNNYIAGYLEDRNALLMPMATLRDVSELVGIKEEDIEVVRKPLCWNDHIDTTIRDTGLLTHLPDFGGKIQVRAERQKIELVRQIAKSLQEPGRYSIVYVCSTTRRVQKVEESLRDLIVWEGYPEDYETTIGPFDLIRATKYGVRPSDLAVILDDPFLLASKVGRCYWESSIRNDVPLFTFVPGPDILPQDRSFIDLRSGVLPCDDVRSPVFGAPRFARIGADAT